MFSAMLRCNNKASKNLVRNGFITLVHYQIPKALLWISEAGLLLELVLEKSKIT